jgi:hypothetical protein
MQMKIKRSKERKTKNCLYWIIWVHPRTNSAIFLAVLSSHSIFSLSLLFSFTRWSRQKIIGKSHVGSPHQESSLHYMGSGRGVSCKAIQYITEIAHRTSMSQTAHECHTRVQDTLVRPMVSVSAKASEALLSSIKMACVTRVQSAWCTICWLWSFDTELISDGFNIPSVSKLN